MSGTLCSYLVEFCGCTFVTFLYSMRPYVIVVGCVRVPGVPVLQELQTHAHNRR